MKIGHLKKNYLHRNELTTVKINLRQSVENLGLLKTSYTDFHNYHIIVE